MAKRGLAGSWFAASQGPAKPHSHRKGKIALRPGAEKARKAEAKRKLRDPKVWGLQQEKPASAVSFWAAFSKKTGDPNRGPQRR